MMLRTQPYCERPSCCLLMFLAGTLLLLFSIPTISGNGVPDGWKMDDRFVGFRYELTPPPSNRIKDVLVSIRDKADELFCFGWVQSSPRGTIVGEARCTKWAGKGMESFISNLAADLQKGNVNGAKELQGATETHSTEKPLEVRYYEDTLIRLHFTHFKILPDDRNTCFRDQPHKCDHLYFEGEDGIPYRER